MTNGAGSLRVDTNIAFGKGGDQELLLDVYYPPEGASKRTAVVQVFGGGFTRGTKEADYLVANAKTLTQRGYVNVAMTYRWAPDTKWPGQLHDLKAAIRWTRTNADKLGIDADKIAVCGYSAGGQLAVIAGATPDDPALAGNGGTPGVSDKVAAVLAYYPSSVNPDSGPGQALMPANATREEYDAISPLTLARPGFPATVFFCGTADSVFPPSYAMKVYEKLEAAGVPADLHMYAGMPHIFDRYTEFGNSTYDICDMFLDRYVVNPRVYEGFVPGAVPATAP